MAPSNHSDQWKSGAAPTLPKSGTRAHEDDEQYTSTADRTGKKKRQWPQRGGKRVQKKKVNAERRKWQEEFVKQGGPRGPKTQRTAEGSTEADHAEKRPAERPSDDGSSSDEFFTSDDEFMDAQSEVDVVGGEGSTTTFMGDLIKDLDEVSISKETPHLDINENASKQRPAKSRPGNGNRGRRNKGNAPALVVLGSEEQAASGEISSASMGCPVDMQTARLGPDRELTILRVTIHGSADFQEMCYRSDGTQFDSDSVTRLSMKLTDNRGVDKYYFYNLSPSLPYEGSTGTYGTAAPSGSTRKR